VSSVIVSLVIVSLVIRGQAILGQHEPIIGSKDNVAEAYYSVKNVADSGDSSREKEESEDKKV
jgi:hypothetical protein